MASGVCQTKIEKQVLKQLKCWKLTLNF